jgi:hypothetical protein
MANLPAPLTSSTKTVLARIDALVAAGAPTLDAVADAVQRADYDQAAELALARSFAGEDLPIEVVTILPGLDAVVTLLAVIKASTTNPARALVDMVCHDRVPAGEVGRDLAAILLYSGWRLREGDDLRELMAWPLRRLLRSTPTSRCVALVAKLVQELGDPNVTSVAKDALPAFLLQHESVQTAAREMDGLLADSPRDLAKLIPLPEALPRVPVRLPMRAAAKPGRNDLCPCGSGKKFKRCCQDKDEASLSLSPVAGLSWDQYLATAANTMTASTIYSLSLRDLGLVNLAQLGMSPLGAVFRRFLFWRRWDLAEHALARIVAHPDRMAGDADGYRAELVAELTSHGEWALARRHADKLVDKAEFVREHAIALALAEAGPDALPRLLAIAERAVREEDDDEAGDFELAYALLDSMPALGILVARGCLTAERQFDSEVLLEQIEKARDRLNLATQPGRPGQRS